MRTSETIKHAGHSALAHTMAKLLDSFAGLGVLILRGEEVKLVLIVASSGVFSVYN
jgi:hypothetical protein